MELTGWGRYPRFDTALVEPGDLAEAARVQKDLYGFVPRGNGRAYGDAAIGVKSSLSTRGLDRFCDFDDCKGLLTVESGVLLDDIITEFLPRGIFPPVVPGTRLVTVGGMIAADVHGKNHHGAGSFGCHVESLVLALPQGATVTCSREENPELFDATIGGMGLTGSILQATFRLLPVETGWIKQTTIVAPDLAAALSALSKHDEAPYSAAWIDCLAKGSALGRSLIYLGEHASARDVEALMPGAPQMPPRRARRLSVPVDLPSFTLNRWSVKAFNEIYFRRGASSAGHAFVNGLDPFFFPLDGLHNWNRMYGRRGFLQHQSVVPAERAHATFGEILERIARRGNASFLAVLKQLGAPSNGLLSFPRPGFTLALDLLIDDGIWDFLDEIDQLVTGSGGAIYLAKDARQSRTTFESGYPHLERFRTIRKEIGAEGRIASRLSDRLGI